MVKLHSEARVTAQPTLKLLKEEISIHFTELKQKKANTKGHFVEKVYNQSDLEHTSQQRLGFLPGLAQEESK